MNAVIKIGRENVPSMGFRFPPMAKDLKLEFRVQNPMEKSNAKTTDFPVDELRLLILVNENMGKRANIIQIKGKEIFSYSVIEYSITLKPLLFN